jgi:hypothetical protein
MQNSRNSRILLLRDGVLDCPSRLDLAAIEVQMAWPNDLVWQKRAYTAIVAEHMKQHLDEMPSADYRAFYCLATEASPLADVRKEWSEKFKRASLVGHFLTDLLGCISLHIDDVTMANLIERVIKPYRMKKDGGELRISLKTFQNQIWPEFRCVAHLWAASLKAIENEGQPFPCHLTKLREFLADAEAFRRLGESSRTKQSPSTVLEPDETFKLPPGLLVEPSVFDFERNEPA